MLQYSSVGHSATQLLSCLVDFCAETKTVAKRQFVMVFCKYLSDRDQIHASDTRLRYTPQIHVYLLSLVDTSHIDASLQKDRDTSHRDASLQKGRDTSHRDASLQKGRDTFHRDVSLSSPNVSVVETRYTPQMHLSL